MVQVNILQGTSKIDRERESERERERERERMREKGERVRDGVWLEKGCGISHKLYKGLEKG